MKALLFSSLVATALAASSATVQNVICTSLADGRLEIAYSLEGAPAIVTLSAMVGEVPVDGINFRQVSGDVNREIATDGVKKIYWRPADDTAKPDGLSSKVGTANALLENAVVKVTAWDLDDPPDVMVVDLSDPFYGVNRISYYENVGSLPGGLLENPVYRFQKLVMKRVHANGVKWICGTAYCGTTDPADAKYDPKSTYSGGAEYPRNRQLDHDYYMGVFELTKGQHSMVMGTLKGGKYNLVGERFLRPADSLSFIDIRGGADHFYPAEPAPGSILGKLRVRTGLKFDLPGEYEWEFAAWAGHGPTVIGYEWPKVGSVPAYWGNGAEINWWAYWTEEELKSFIDLKSDMSKKLIRDDGLPGRYAVNSGYYDPATLSKSAAWSDATVYGPTNATALCGSYAPNDFGLYDMHGNVREWCLDYYAKGNSGELADPKGPINANGLLPRLGTVDGRDVTTNRVLRGGSFLSTMQQCRASSRAFNCSSFASARVDFGCRIVCPVADRMINK